MATFASAAAFARLRPCQASPAIQVITGAVKITHHSALARVAAAAGWIPAGTPPAGPSRVAARLAANGSFTHSIEGRVRAWRWAVEEGAGANPTVTVTFGPLALGFSGPGWHHASTTLFGVIPLPKAVMDVRVEAQAPPGSPHEAELHLSVSAFASPFLTASTTLAGADPAAYQPLLHKVVLFDGYCAACDASGKFIIRRDPLRHTGAPLFKFAGLQKRVGLEAAAFFNVPPHYSTDLSSVLLVEPDGAGGYRIKAKSEAVAGILRHLEGPWPLLGYALMCLPRTLRDGVYDYVGAHRLAWFGVLPASPDDDHCPAQKQPSELW